MSGTIKYIDAPLNHLRHIPGLLPSPDELVIEERGVEVTIASSKGSVEFFKRKPRHKGPRIGG